MPWPPPTCHSPLVTPCTSRGRRPGAPGRFLLIRRRWGSGRPWLSVGGHDRQGRRPVAGPDNDFLGVLDIGSHVSECPNFLFLPGHPSGGFGAPQASCELHHLLTPVSSMAAAGPGGPGPGWGWGWGWLFSPEQADAQVVRSSQLPQGCPAAEASDHRGELGPPGFSTRGLFLCEQQGFDGREGGTVATAPRSRHSFCVCHSLLGPRALPDPDGGWWGAGGGLWWQEELRDLDSTLLRAQEGRECPHL